MSSKERFLYFAIVFFGIYYLVNMYSSNEEKYIIEYTGKIEALKSKMDSLHNVNNILVYEIDSINQHIVKLDKEINLQDSKIITLKNQTNEKIISVDFFNNDELERFFAERYNR
tara:strand:+ start:438 stop:779 length:342 start_codon:yes stop_codon:yes gene_type:complete